MLSLSRGIEKVELSLRALELSLKASAVELSSDLKAAGEMEPVSGVGINGRRRWVVDVDWLDTRAENNTDFTLECLKLGGLLVREEGGLFSLLMLLFFHLIHLFINLDLA